MKTKILKIVSALMVAVMLLCSSPVGSAEYNSTVISSLAAAKKIKLKKSKVTLITGESYTQKLLNEKGKAITKNVKWSTANKKTATVSSKGKVTAKKAGKVKITAKYKNKKYTFTVTVKNAVLSEKKKTLKEGKSFTLTLKGNGKKISTKSIKFKTSDKKVATVSSKGKVTAVAPGKATITATYKGKAYKCTVTVKGVYKLEFESKKLPAGTSFSQSLLDPDGKRVDNDKIMWNSDNTEVATVSSNGVVVGWKTGEATIYAIYKDEIYKSTVKVVNETAIVFSAEVTVGTIGLIQLRDKNGSIVSNSEIKWSSDDEKVIVVLPNGMAAARAEGTATITAEYKDKKYKHTVTVVKASDKGEATTMYPTTTAPVTMAPTTAPETTIASMKDYSASEIVEAYNKFINNAKRYTYPVAIHKTEVMNAKATEVPSALKSVIDRSISILTKPSEWSKTFVDGREVNGADRNLSEVLPPMSRDCSLEKSDVASAKITATKNGYDIVIVLKEETELFDGTSMTKEAVSHNKAVNLINFAALDTGPITVQKAETTYSGATLEMSVDKFGKITRLRTFTPAECNINVKMSSDINFKGVLEGSLEEIFEFSYDVNTQIPSTTGPVVAPIITAPVTTAPPQYTYPATPTTGPLFTYPAVPDTTYAPVWTTSVPTTAAPGITTPLGDASTAEVVMAYNNAVNDAKNYSGDVTVHKNSSVDVALKDLPTIAEKILTPVVSNLTTPTEWTRSFVGGYDEENGRYLRDVIPPSYRECQLAVDDVVSATSTETKDGFDIVIVLKEETAVFDGTSMTKDAVSHNKAMDTLNPGALDLGPVIISNAEMTYTGATLEMSIDKKGRITRLHIVNPVEAQVQGKAVVSLSLNANGAADDLLEFTYN